MFSKRPKNKVDILEGIGEAPQDDQQNGEEPKLQKKVKQVAIQGEAKQLVMPEQIEQQKASFLLDESYRNRHAVEIETTKHVPNEVVNTIKKNMQIKQINPNAVETSKEEKPEARSKIRIQAPANVRFTSRFDYNPSLCKDYHDTGYCTFGDSCIYIHDRGDYKSGWEQEKEWEEQQKQRAIKMMKKMNGEENEESEDEELRQALENYEVPEVCQICGGQLQHPVVTRCEHYFCSKCAIDQFRRKTQCYTCNKQTNGIFHDAKVKINKIIQKREAIMKEFQKNQVGITKQKKVKAPVQIQAHTEALNIREYKQNHIHREDENPVVVCINDEDEDMLEIRNRVNQKRQNVFQLTESDYLL